MVYRRKGGCFWVLWGDAIWTRGGGCKGASRSTRAAAATMPCRHRQGAEGAAHAGWGRRGDDRGRGRDGVDLPKRSDGADSPKAEPGEAAYPLEP
jgi:hypothetical protein